ncbi:MAG: hypothetical protein M3Z29_07230 [Pseudomonadota bacterium]|nr:hypothetical protein [Pseudomonadota bacterium]
MHSIELTFAKKMTFAMLVFPACSALAANDACTVLTAEKFGDIMGYKASINKQASTDTVCMYRGTGNAGGMLMIIDEAASPKQLDMLNRAGSVPQGKAGKLGATFSKGGIVFTVGITGTDPAKVNALAEEVKRNLK